MDVPAPEEAVQAAPQRRVHGQSVRVLWSGNEPPHGVGHHAHKDERRAHCRRDVRQHQERRDGVPDDALRPAACGAHAQLRRDGAQDLVRGGIQRPRVWRPVLVAQAARKREQATQHLCSDLQGTGRKKRVHAANHRCTRRPRTQKHVMEVPKQQQHGCVCGWVGGRGTYCTLLRRQPRALPAMAGEAPPLRTRVRCTRTCA